MPKKYVIRYCHTYGNHPQNRGMNMTSDAKSYALDVDPFPNISRTPEYRFFVYNLKAEGFIPSALRVYTKKTFFGSLPILGKGSTLRPMTLRLWSRPVYFFGVDSNNLQSLNVSHVNQVAHIYPTYRDLVKFIPLFCG